MSNNYLEKVSSSLKAATISLENDDSIVTVLKDMKTTLSQRNNPLTLPKESAIADAMEAIFAEANASILKGVKNRDILDKLGVSIRAVLKEEVLKEEVKDFIADTIQKVTTYPIPITYNDVNRSYIRLSDLADMLDVPKEDVLFILGKKSGVSKLEYHRDSRGIIFIHEGLVQSILTYYSPKIAKAFGDRNLF